MGNNLKFTVMIGLLIIPFISFASVFYWVGGSGNWSAYANHWATTSGGNIFHTQVPSSLDDVVFDANSFTASGQTVTADQTIVYCKNMDWSNVLNNPTFASIGANTVIKIFASLSLSANMNMAFNGIMSFEALTNGNTIRTYSKVLQCRIILNGFGGEWILADSLSTIKEIRLNYGTFRTSNHNFRCSDFFASTIAPASLYLGTSIITISGHWSITDSLLIIDADSSIIKITWGDGTFVHNGSDSFVNKYNIIKFTNSPGINQALNGKNIKINKLFFEDYSILISNKNLFIDSLIANGSLEINSGSGLIKINYANIIGDFSYIISMNAADTINNLIAYEWSNITLSGNSPRSCFFRKAIFYGSLYINGYQNSDNYKAKFDNCTIFGDGNFNMDSVVFDTLRLKGIGHTYTFGSNKTQHITKLFDCVGDPGFPIQLVSNNVGQQATLNISQDYFCSDYLYMRDMKGTGSPDLYAGANSNNVYNNSGWIFSECNVGINENYDFDIKIYPNPVTQFLSLTLQENNKNIELKIYNSIGQIVLISQFETQEIKLDVSTLNAGLYFLEITENHNTLKFKFIKD